MSRGFVAAQTSPAFDDQSHETTTQSISQPLYGCEFTALIRKNNFPGKGSLVMLVEILMSGREARRYR